MKKVIVYIILLLLLVYSACQNDEGIESSTKSAINDFKEPAKKFKWLGHWFGQGKKETLLREIARDFSFQNQDLDFTLEFPHEMANVSPGFSQKDYLSDSIVKMIETNNWPYDVMYCGTWMYDLVARKIKDQDWGAKYFIDLKNEPWFINAHKESIFLTDLNTRKLGGVAPGAYIEGSWNVLYVSSEVQNKLGIKVKKHGMNIDDFISYAKAVHDYNAKNEDKITFFWQQRNREVQDLLSQLTMSYIEKDSADNIKEAFIALEHVYRKLEEIAQYEPLNQYTQPKDPRDLNVQDVLFIPHSSWITIFWNKNFPNASELVHPCELPSMNNKTATVYSGYYSAPFVIPKNGKNTKTAINLMKFICSENVAEKWVKYSKSPTGINHRMVYAELSQNETNLFSQYIKNKYNDRLAQVNLSQTLFKTHKTINLKAKELMGGVKSLLLEQ